MAISKVEQETMILFNETAPLATVYTYNGVLKRKLAGLCVSRPDEVKQIKDDGQGGLTFEVPKRWIKVNAGIILSDEQRKARADAAKARFSSKTKEISL